MKFYDAGEEWTIIYGLFDESGACLYVGQSLDLWQRKRDHKRKKPSHEARVIQRTRLKNASKVELGIIKKYKRLGQCQLNKATWEISSDRKANGYKFYLPKHDTAFRSWNQMARFLGVSVVTVKNHAKEGYLVVEKLHP